MNEKEVLIYIVVSLETVRFLSIIKIESNSPITTKVTPPVGIGAEKCMLTAVVPDLIISNTPRLLDLLHCWSN